ncbi:hypothetical protein TNCV_3857951 [Trichonephila clavipes]|nr:hypothetical protein TNCV_3857951 [Trichonephila clavipes]
MNPASKELLKRELDFLLQQGIIVECESPYTSPVVFIEKPNGSMRLCIDYRTLNAQTVPDSYPLPRTDDLLNEAKPTPYISTIDLRSGYHQVKVAEKDQDKTAFTCPFEFRQEQLKDDELRKIIECFENNEKSVNFANWLEKGYLINQGILFRYSPTSESEEAQLVVPIHEIQAILETHHDAPNAGDKVWVTLHHLSNAAHKKTAKFLPKRDGPYIIVTQCFPMTYEVANPNNPHEVLEPYHSSADASQEKGKTQER